MTCTLFIIVLFMLYLLYLETVPPVVRPQMGVLGRTTLIGGTNIFFLLRGVAVRTRFSHYFYDEERANIIILPLSFVSDSLETKLIVSKIHLASPISYTCYLLLVITAMIRYIDSQMEVSRLPLEQQIDQMFGDTWRSWKR